jgi:hypothetical protein
MPRAPPDALHATGADLRRATVEDVQAALEAMRSKAISAAIVSSRLRAMGRSARAKD